MIKRTSILFVLLLFVFNAYTDEKNLFNIDLYEKAIEHLKNLEIEESISLFQEMIIPPEGEIWTCQAILVCDRNDLLEKSNQLIKETSLPIMVIKRIVNSKECFRLCTGIFSDKTSALEIGKTLPSPFKEAKPYPLQLAKKGELSEIAFSFQSKTEKDDFKEEIAPKNEISYKEEKESYKTDLGEELFLKGLTAYNSNDFKSAETYFRQSIAIRPSRFETYNNLGAILLEQKRYEEAKEVLEKAVSIQPFYPNSRANLAGAYWFLGMKEEAITEAKRAFRLNASNVDYSLTLASFLYELGRYEEAKTYINAAKLIAPENPNVLALASKIDEKLGIVVKDSEENFEDKRSTEKSAQVEIEDTNEYPSSNIETKEKEEKKEKKGFFKRIFRKKSNEKKEDKND